MNILRVSIISPCISPNLPCYACMGRTNLCKIIAHASCLMPQACRGRTDLCKIIAKENFLKQGNTWGDSQLNKIKIMTKIKNNWREFNHRRINTEKKTEDIRKLYKTQKRMEYNSLCWNCSKNKEMVKLFKCKGCYRARYCSRKCIEEDWDIHQSYCRKKEEKRKNTKKKRELLN